MRLGRRLLSATAIVTIATFGATAAGDAVAVSVPTGGTAGPLPPPVPIRAEPDGVTLADPTFQALPGARADFGRIGGTVYQIEVPDHWNGRLVLFMHGWLEFGPEARVSAPDGRRYLIAHGIAWGASSFSSNSLIPGRAADETAALWDYFARTYGRPTRTYITGFSMGGLATHIAAERYANRFDGALALCGSAGTTPGLKGGADFFAAGAYVAGVTQAEFDAAGTNVGALIRDRILPALRDPAAHDRFERIMVDLTGGPRPFGREGFHFEEETNWRRSSLEVAAGIAPNQDTKYRLGPHSPVTSAEFNRAVIRFRTNEAALRAFVEGGELTGNLEMPLVTLHTTGDGQVPFEQARILQRRVDAAGKQRLLVQRVFRDSGHCGFTTTEWEAAYEALVGWVEHGVKPKGSNVFADPRTLDGAFEFQPRGGTPQADAVPGAHQRVVVRGRLTLDGAPFDARFLGAIVLRNGLITPCQYTLPGVDNGRYEITVLANAESTGCGAKGARVVLWTFAQGEQLFSNGTLRWPAKRRTATFDATFSTSTPAGAAPPRTEFSGEVFDRHGRQMGPGTRIEAFIGTTRCGVASVRRTGSYSGYILSVVGPDSVAGCTSGGTITFRIAGRPAIDTAVNDISGGASQDLTLR